MYLSNRLQILVRGLLGLLLLVMAGASSWAAEREVRIGVLSFRPLELTAAQWEPTRAAIAAALPGDNVTLTPYYREEIKQAVAEGKLDFILANPEVFIQLRRHYGLAAMGTLMPLASGHPVNQFGGVIFTRADRQDINELRDLEDRAIAAVSQESLGSYLMQRWEMFRAGYSINKKRLMLTGLPQDKVVAAVLGGQAEVGFIRTGVLEALMQEGKLAPGSFKLINPQNPEEFPQLYSTELYPEWPIAASHRAPPEVVKVVSQVLLSLRPDSPAARKGGYYGFAPPGDYSAIEAIMMRLHAIPTDPDSFGLEDVLDKYANALLAGLSLFVLAVLVATARLFSLNRRLRHALAEKKRLEWSEVLLSSTGEGVIGLDASGHASFINPAALKMLGMSREQALGADFVDCFGQTGECRLQSCESWVKRPDGESFLAQLTVSDIITDDMTHGMVVIFQDITERRKDEEFIREANQRLTEQAKLLAQSNQDLEQFAYVASHDLRQPLRQIASFVSMIERRLGKDASEELLEFIHFARSGAERLDRLILDLLEFSRIGRKSGEIEPLALKDCAAEAAQALALMVEESGASLTLAIPAELPEISGHHSEIVRLFQNLISNALKYHAADRPPVVTVTGEWDGAKTITLSITDNGIGIAPEFFERIFGIFQRLHAPGEYEGTGIGLAVCKKIVEEHGGRIGVESTPGQGSRFFFTLPVGKLSLRGV